MFGDLLATKRGRLTAFFFLYLTEGIPLGFTATAVATWMRRQGVGPAEIGAFVGSLYLPWAWKWVTGPLVDTFSSDRLGRRRAWIVAMQFLMCGMLLVAMPVDFAAELKLFTAIVMVLNVFGATQDVAIDALACGVLQEEERGLANGLMFGGQILGQAVGGSGVLYLSGVLGTDASFLFVVACVLSVTFLVSIRLKEPRGKARPRADGSRFAEAGREIGRYAREAVRAFFGTRPARVGLVFALLPAGAFALSLALASNLQVELGMKDAEIATLTLVSTLVSAAGCIAGGWLSDRFGRRRMLALYLVGTALPTVGLAWLMWRHGWVWPVDPRLPGRPVPPGILIGGLWGASLVYSVFQGLLTGTRTALFMDICTPAVAATQFTAYMAMINLVTWYTARWQGVLIEAMGYPVTMAIDAGFGLLGIALLPAMVPLRTGPPGEPAGDAAAEAGAGPTA